jgi:two-component system OmpR family sensor kinase
LQLLELLIGLGVVIVLAGAGYFVVRRSLRPLTEVEQTAAAIAAGDLSQRVPPAHPGTEVGRLSAALNTMLGQIERAFHVQRESEQSARRSEEQMRQFVADASHELRTPLTSIRGFAELFRQGAVSDPDELERVMRRIEDEGARMGVLVDDLLLLARLDQRRPLQRDPVDLGRLASDAVEDVRMVAPGRPIDLVVDDEDSPIVVGDELRLRQVLGNLLGNALTHTPHGAAIHVRLGSRADDSGRWAVLEVADEGPGLDREHADRVFERFYRVDAARTRSHGGSGLGLSIVAGLAEAHGGRVELETVAGEGATFRVVLPLAAAPDVATV